MPGSDDDEAPMEWSAVPREFFAETVRGVLAPLMPNAREPVPGQDDTLYFYCREEDIEETVEIARALMDEATRRVIGDRVKIAIDAKVYRSDKRFFDPRGAETLALVERLIGEQEADPKPLIEVVPPKPKKEKPPLEARKPRAEKTPAGDKDAA